MHEQIAGLEAMHVVDRELIAHLEAEEALGRDKIANLEFALRSARRIGAATGILMTRLNVSDDHAFDMLRAASQHRQVKLRDLAEEVIHTGELTMTPGVKASHQPFG
jgi:AmiR/NasT family two-component response regulator